MSWRGTKGGIVSAKEGHDVVMAPNEYTYFDYYQNPGDRELAREKEYEAIGGFLPIAKVYSFDPVIPGSLSAKEQKHILGVQAQLWTEYMKTWDKVEYMALPRMAALSEIAWTSPDKKNYTDFVERLVRLRKRYKIMGVNACEGALLLPKKKKNK
jgi:hexosaminidase